MNNILKDGMNDASGKTLVIKKTGFVISHILVLVWMYVIFNFSAQQGEESAGLSDRIGRLLMTFWNQIFGLGWDEGKLLAMTELIAYPIRKIAHMTEYGILAVLIWAALGHYANNIIKNKRYIIAWIGAVIYAATDEIHQLFVPGRSGNLFDVCVDATGAAIALLLLCGAMHILRKITTKK